MPTPTTAEHAARLIRQWRAGALALSLSAILLVLATIPVTAADATVLAHNYGYVAPDGSTTVTIRVGDAVRWTFQGEVHSVTSGLPGVPDGRFDSGLRNPGDTFRWVFPTPGTYRYFCQVHPEEMHGTVIVRGATTTASSRPRPTATATPGSTTTRSPQASATTTSPSNSPAVSASPGPSGSVATTATDAPSATGSASPTGVGPSAAPAASSGSGSSANLALVPAALALAGLGIVGAALVARRRH